MDSEPLRAMLCAMNHQLGRNKALYNDWALNHCFKHDPRAIVNFVLTLFIAFVLVQSFYRRNLKPQARALFGTLIAIADELYVSLCIRQSCANLFVCLAQPPP